MNEISRRLWKPTATAIRKKPRRGDCTYSQRASGSGPRKQTDLVTSKTSSRGDRQSRFKSKRLTNHTAHEGYCFAHRFRLAQAAGVSSPIRLIGRLASPGRTEPR